MAKYEVVPSRVYQAKDGRRASIHGAVPWRNQSEKEFWNNGETVLTGFTVYNPLTGQYGIGRKPWETREEAQKFADSHQPSSIGLGD